MVNLPKTKYYNAKLPQKLIVFIVMPVIVELFPEKMDIFGEKNYEAKIGPINCHD